MASSKLDSSRNQRKIKSSFQLLLFSMPANGAHGAGMGRGDCPCGINGAIFKMCLRNSQHRQTIKLESYGWEYVVYVLYNLTFCRISSIERPTIPHQFMLDSFSSLVHYVFEQIFLMCVSVICSAFKLPLKEATYKIDDVAMLEIFRMHIYQADVMDMNALKHTIFHIKCSGPATHTRS